MKSTSPGQPALSIGALLMASVAFGRSREKKRGL